MVINYYNIYCIASLHPRLTISKFDTLHPNEGCRDVCKGTYIVPFTLSANKNKFWVKIENPISALSKWRGFTQRARGTGAYCAFEASSLKDALKRSLAILDYALFTNFLDAVENQTFVLPYSTNPIRFADVNVEKLSAKGYVNHHKAVLAFRPESQAPYKVRISTPKGKVVLDATNMYAIQKMLRNFRG